jgi:hypothetical protein
MVDVSVDSPYLYYNREAATGLLFSSIFMV